MQKEKVGKSPTFLYLTRGLIKFHSGGGLDGRNDVAWTNQGDVRHHHDAEVEQQ